MYTFQMPEGLTIPRKSLKRSRVLHMNMRCLSSGSRFLGVGIALWILQTVCLAQTPDLRPGNFELGLYGGASYGVDSFRPLGGVNLSSSLPKLLLPYVEFSYFPESVRNYVVTDTRHVLSSSPLDLHAGVHTRPL